MRVNWTITGDGLATLVAGIIAFCAVWWQVRSSTSNLQKQLDTEREARNEELRRRKVGMARVMLVDLTAVYFTLRSLDSLRSTDPDCVRPLPLFKAIPSEWSMVFSAISSMLGDLDAHVVSAVVACYSAGANFLACIRDYEASAERVHKGDDIFEQDIISRRLLAGLKCKFEELRLSLYLASWSLCSFAGVPFCSRDVPVASECDLLEKLAKTQPELAEAIQKSAEDA
ncbi:MAG TPA: hypothetical protein VFQ24_07590 [Terriglobia bacterium]|nr:hypothetical protein [Terriglobia bacterium]